MTSAHIGRWDASIRVGGAAADPDEPQVIVRDRRRIDPESGQVRAEAITVTTAGATTAAAASADTSSTSATGVGAAAWASSDAPEPQAPPVDSELVDSLRAQVAERTEDLQRLKAEFDNYRRRVDRDRQLVADQAVGRLLGTLLPTLDDIGRARDHGDLEGPLEAVVKALETTLEAAGLERYGQVGEAFDPLVHDALMHSYRSDVTEPTCVEVYRAGYRHAGRVLRPAQVVVAEPPPAEEPVDAGSAAETLEAAEPGGAAGTAEAVTEDPSASAGGEPTDVPGGAGGIPGAEGGPAAQAG